MKNIKIKYSRAVKYLNSLINKILLKQNIKIKYNRVTKYLNSLINKILLKQNIKKEKNFSNKLEFKISSFNKYIIFIISLLFSYLFYLLIPTFYDKNWVQNTLEKKLLSELKVDISLSSDIVYEILPSPHFSIKNGKIIDQNISEHNEIAEIEELKVFISSKSFFNKDKLKINSISINKANFFYKKNKLSLYKKIISNKSFIEKIKIKKSNLFIKNKENEIISIIKIPQGIIFYDDLNQLNTLSLKGEVFNIPFTLQLSNQLSPTNIDEIDLNFKKINLDFYNSLFKKNNGIISGLNILKIFNSKLVTDYEYKNNLIMFHSVVSQVKKTEINYKGIITLKPFNFELDLDLERVDLFKLTNPNSIFLELIKNGILFNENISAKINLQSDDLKGNKFFDNIKFLLNIRNGKIDFNQTLLLNEDIGSLKIKSSDLFFSNNKLILSSEININIENLDKFYSLLQTPKKIRKDINNIIVDFDYDFLENHMKIKRLKIDNSDLTSNTENIINDFNDQNTKNFIKSRSFINRLLQAYFG
jgi:hypothetical protein